MALAEVKELLLVEIRVALDLVGNGFDLKENVEKNVTGLDSS